MHDMDCAYCSWFGFQAFSHGIQEAVEMARPLCEGELSAHAALSVIVDRILEREIGHDPAERYEGPPVLVAMNLVESGDDPVVAIREELDYPGLEEEMGVVIGLVLRMGREDLGRRIRRVNPAIRKMKEPAVLGYWDLDRMQRVYSFRSSSRYPVVFADVSREGRSGTMVLNISAEIDLSHVQYVNVQFSRFTAISRFAMGAYKSELIRLASKFGMTYDPVWGLPAEEMMRSVEKMIARFPVYAEEKWRRFDRELAGEGIRSLTDLLRVITLSISRELGLEILQQ